MVRLFDSEVQYTTHNTLSLEVVGERHLMMQSSNFLDTALEELDEGMQLAKCQKCGCMKDALTELASALESLDAIERENLAPQIHGWQAQMQPIQYACLGCSHCFPAVATNQFSQAYPDVMNGQTLACDFQVQQEWPVVAGEYYHFCEGQACPVAVSTLASVELTEQLATIRPPELCIVGKTETENIGIDKIIKNIVSNPDIRFLVLAGQDPQGHYPGQTLLALSENGVDEKMRVIGSQGKRPILRNVSREEVNQFRQQVQTLDLIGCDDADEVVSKLGELAQQPLPVVESCSDPSCSCHTELSVSVATIETCSDTSCACHTKLSESVPVIEAHEPRNIVMDKAGYFVILVQADKKNILVEHYAYDNSLLRTIQGHDARNIYWTIIENNWVSELSHAAYLGKELAKAELSLIHDFKYVQDGA